MTFRTRTNRARRAFTLPELLVVVTITLILMSILVTASGIMTSTVSSAKAQGDFVAQERMAFAILRRDLQYDHFLEEDGKPNLGRKLSDQRTDALYTYDAGPPAPPPALPNMRLAGYRPPRSGYFLASSRPAVNALPSTYNPSNSATWNFQEGTDSDGFASSRSGNHFLAFTIIVPGGAPENTLTADVPYQNTPFTNSYPITGTCAEVAYFLVPNGTTPPPPIGNGIAKFKLVRRQRLAARNGDDAPAYSALLNASGAAATDPPEVMAVTGGAGSFKALTMNELTFAGNRVPRTPIATHRIGEDVLHHSVTSFEIKFTGSAGSAAGVQWPTPFANGNTDYPYDNLPFDGNYDTFNQGPNWDLAANLATNANPGRDLKAIRITGAQIRLRYWSQSTKSTRQTTIVVDL